MVRRIASTAVSISLLLWLAASQNQLFAAKDQSRVGRPAAKTPSLNSPFSPHNTTDDEPDARDDPEQILPFGVLNPEDVPDIKSIELTSDIAKRAVDALLEVHEKYNDQGIDDYETLEEFVAATDAGKQLEADLRKFRFRDIEDWNTSITSVGFAYSSVSDDQELEIRQQIKDIKAATDIDTAAKQKMLTSLEAMIPSENNKTIIRQLMRDAYYADKLKLLDETE